MDCMQEWSERVTNEQIHHILELGELIVILPPEERPWRVTLLAVQLAGDRVARSESEAYVMLMESYAHAMNMQLMNWYEGILNSLNDKIEAVKVDNRASKSQKVKLVS